jgi:pimeloyl-ACP methyl ester carboxylesterase
LNWRRLGRRILIAVIVIVAIVEIFARVTRWTHNRRVAGLGDRLSVRVSGSGKPVVFLHGFRGSGSYWGEHFNSIPGLRAIRPDLLGFGNSRWPLTSYTTAEHIAAVRRSIAPYTGGRKITVVGHSMGAILALEWARRYPSEIDRVIVLNLPLFQNERDARKRLRALSEMASAFAVQPFLARSSCDLLCALRPIAWHAAPLIEPDIPAEVARDAVMHRWESFDRTLRNVVLGSRAGETMMAIRGIPITIIHGQQDNVSDHSVLRNAAAAAGAELLFVPGDHNAFLRRPEMIGRMIVQRVDLSRSPATHLTVRSMPVERSSTRDGRLR